MTIIYFEWQNHQRKHIITPATVTHPPSSAKPHRDLFLMSRITGKPPILSRRGAAPRLFISAYQNPKLLANQPLKEQTNSDVEAHYL